jgi:hypothetical protein
VDGENTDKCFKYGEKVLSQIIEEKYRMSNIEILIFLFDTVFGPDFIFSD